MVNDLGVDPNDWFDDSKKNPLDSMPIATNKYHPDEKMADWYDNAPSEYEPPDDWFIEKKPKVEEKKEEKTMHHFFNCLLRLTTLYHIKKNCSSSSLT